MYKTGVATTKTAISFWVLVFKAGLHGCCSLVILAQKGSI